MKKYIALLAAAILAVSLAACESETDSPTEVPTASTAPQAETPTTPVHQHSYAKTIITPTCTAAGYTEYTCDCGDSYFQDLINAAGHSYGEKVVAPTADAEGYTEHTCTACGDVYTGSFVDRIDPSHKHSYTATKTVAPTCMSMGYTVYSCTCGDSYMKNPVDAAGHSYTEKVIEPTIDNKGYTEHTCTACGDVFTDSFMDALPAPHQHQYFEAEVYTPNCIAEGCSLYRCDCGDVFYGNYTAMTDHSFASTVVAPTHTTEGFTAYHCTVCDDWYRDTFVDRTPEHTYVVSDVLEPTCAMEGFTLYCCDCGDYYTADHVAATGHSYVVDRVVEPTYDAQGYTVYSCTSCGDTYHDDYTEKLQPEEENGHKCSGDCHVEIQQGGYTYVYCDTIESPYLSEDGFTVYYPYDYYF